MPEINSNSDFIAPVYLDTQLLTDILASIYDGFSLVEKVNSRFSSDEKNMSKFSSEFGIPNFFNMLKIGISGGNKKESSTEATEVQSYDKYHTYGSLLFRSILHLRKFDLIKEISNFNALKVGDFVEIKGQVSDNPVLDAVKKIQLFINFITEVMPMFDSSPKNLKKNNINDLKNINKFVSNLDHSIKESEFSTIVFKMIDKEQGISINFVARIINECLRDKSLRELFSGEYRMFGKIIKIIDKNDSIDLLKNTSFSILKSSHIQEFIQNSAQFRDLFTHDFIQMPEIKTQIEGPALQILPISIYI